MLDGLPPYPRTQELGRAQPPTRWPVVALLCLGIVVVYGVLFAAVREMQGREPAAAQIPFPTTTYYNQFNFADSVPIADRQWIVQAVAHARPEAVRLIELIDQDTTVAPLRDEPYLGLTSHLLTRHQRVRLSLKALDGGQRANRELTFMHELGHVIDNVLVSDAVRARLVGQVPTLGFCRRKGDGDCAPPQEKFADTFAKWAYRGAHFYYGAGYDVPVPRSLDAWGAPLTRIGQAASRYPVARGSSGSSPEAQ